MFVGTRTFEDAPAQPSGGGIPWYAAVITVLVLGLAASIIDWVIGEGVGVATGIAFLIGCVVLGGRVRIEHIVVGFVAAPVCFAAIVATSGAIQVFGDERSGAAFRVFWTYALISGAPWLLVGTAISVLLAFARVVRWRRAQR